MKTAKKKKRHRLSFIVSAELPEGATARDMENYIRDAVQTWHGSLDPGGHDDEEYGDGDPMFDLNSRTVTVKRCGSRSR